MWIFILPALQEALEAAKQEISAGGTAVVTLQNNTSENLEIDQTITILKNGFTAQNIKPASGYLLNETSESYSIYAFTPPAPTQVYTVKYLLGTA